MWARALRRSVSMSERKSFTPRTYPGEPIPAIGYLSGTVLIGISGRRPLRTKLGGALQRLLVADAGRLGLPTSWPHPPTGSASAR